MFTPHLFVHLELSEPAGIRVRLFYFERVYSALLQLAAC